MLSAKLDLLIKKLDHRAGDKKEVMHVYNSHMTCEECGDTGHSGNHYPKMLEDVNYINNNYYYYNLSKKLASNDKMLENINNRMDNFSIAINNQISFNKMIESQLNQIVVVVPATNPSIPSQPEGLESANLVDMFDAGNYSSNPVTKVTTDLLPVKRGDPGRPVIPISVGMVDFPEVLCDFGSSVNIMPRVLYEKFFTYPLLETTMCL